MACDHEPGSLPTWYKIFLFVAIVDLCKSHLIIVLLEVELLDLPLEIFQMTSELVEGLEEGLPALMDDVDPAVKISKESLQVLKF